MHVAEKLAAVKVDHSDKPVVTVLISHCGELELRPKPRIESNDKSANDKSSRGRKRTYSSPSHSRSKSQSRKHSSDDGQSYHKQRKQMESPPPTKTVKTRRRSDVAIDETRRGRPSRRILSPATNIADSMDQKYHMTRKRSASPSRSPAHHGSPSPHLRREHPRSRTRSPTGLKRRARDRMHAREHKHEYRLDEEQLRTEEKEREGVRDRFEGVVEDECIDRKEGKRQGYDSRRHGQGTYHCSGNGDRNGGQGAGIDGTGGEVKFKGRGSMKYRERKW